MGLADKVWRKASNNDDGNVLELGELRAARAITAFIKIYLDAKSLCFASTARGDRYL